MPVKKCPHGYTKLRCYKCREKRIIAKADKKLSKSRIKKHLDTIYSHNVRLRGCSDNLVGRCFSCRKVLPYDKLENGHYISRSQSSITYFLHDNCRPQCVGCNKFKEGNKSEFRKYLVEEFGENKVIQMENISRSPMFKALTEYEMKVRIKEEIKELKQHVIRTGLELPKETKRIIALWDN
ncbi:MAG: recombination protein NinG [Bacteroidia bacterium]|nr:recombination protein NinG [Bacteroidia bacterium]